MKSLIHHHESLQIPLGERRKKSDLERFSLDLSRAKEIPSSAPLRAYPSPPMSGSSPLPPRLNYDPNDRLHGSHTSGGGPGLYRGLPTPQQDHMDKKVQLHRSYSSFNESASIPSLFRSEHIPSLSAFQNSLQSLPQHSHHHHQQQQEPPQQYQLSHSNYLSHHSQVVNPLHQPIYTSLNRPPARDQPGFTSPKQQRKTKGHVASACVPCKKAHLRCDAQRPCSRCVSNGKEDSCVDVQHKKRGRPRLRDDREPRYDGITPGYSSTDLVRRPLSLYSPIDHLNSSFVQQRQVPILQNTRSVLSLEPACAYLSLEFAVLKATKSFGETIGMQSVLNRHFQDIISHNDKEKLYRIQLSFEEERREREPNYLPPIYLTKYEEDRVVQTIGFGPDDIGKVRTDRQEMLTFQAPDGQQRTFQVRMGLAKKSSIYFIVALLHVPATPSYQQSPTSPYRRESQSHESLYGYHSSMQGYPQNHSSVSFPTASAYSDGRPDLTSYRTQDTVGPSISYTSMGAIGLIQPPLRPDLSQLQTSYQVPRSELLQANHSRQHNLQLPPIRNQYQQRDYGKGRLGIGGLLDDSHLGRPRG